jgi:hypothetical protein
MIASGNILHDDLILEIARQLNLGYGIEVSELLLDRPQVLAEKASRILQLHVAYIGSNDFAEEVYRIGAQLPLVPHGSREPSPVPAPQAAGRGFRHPLEALHRFFA